MEREEVRFQSGGQSCAATLVLPDRGNEAPCVVLGSGLSCVRDQGLVSFAERLAGGGFAALAIDYRHFGGSDGEPRGLVSGARQREDLLAALAYARSRPEIDAERLALWGYSLGGGNVQAVTIAEPGAVAAAICVAPVISGLASLLHVGGWRHVGRLMWAGLHDGARALRGSEPYRVPAAGPPGSLAALNSPDSLPGFEAITPPGSSWSNSLCARVALVPPYRLGGKVRRLGCPVLYCLTEDDDINPPRLGRLAAERAPRAELRTYPGGHFAPFLGEQLDRMAEDQVDFLRRHLAIADQS